MTEKKKEFDGFRKTGIDDDIELRIETHCEKYSISPLNAVILFPVLARRQLLKRFLAHAELFMKTIDVQGDIAELGVFRGLGLMTWANLLETYCIGNRTKTVYGFDNWKGFCELSPEDGKDEEEVQKYVGGFSPKKYREELMDAIKIFDADRFIPWKPRVKIIEGNIENTAKEFVEQYPGIRFSLIHFDCDLYEPTKAALKHLYPRLSRGGICLFDEYGIKEFPGETIAVDEYFADKPGVKIKTLIWNNAPAGYIIKE